MIDLFYRAYPRLPDRLINRAGRRLATASRPRWLVRAAVATWCRMAHIDRSDFEWRDHASLEDFFLRRLRPGSRALGDGVISPVDGIVVDGGTIADEATTRVKGQALDIAKVLGAAPGQLPEGLRGGQFASIYLTPGGYHWVHAPVDLAVRELSWVPGRRWPQNARARRQLGDVSAVNERLTLAFDAAGGWQGYLTMVAASVVGGIHVCGLTPETWQQDAPVATDLPLARGEPLGYFTFGSTVVLMVPPHAADRWRLCVGQPIRMGQALT